MAATYNTDTPDYISGGVLADTEAWVAVAHETLSSDASSVTFQSSTGANNWSQYQDLLLIASTRSTNASTQQNLRIVINDSTSTSIQMLQYLRGSGTTTTTAYNDNNGAGYWVAIPAASNNANKFGVAIIRFFNVNTGYMKSALTYGGFDDDGMGNVGIATQSINYGYPASSSMKAVEKIDIKADTGDLVDTSTFDLFGILPHMDGANFA